MDGVGPAQTTGRWSKLPARLRRTTIVRSSFLGGAALAAAVLLLAAFGPRLAREIATLQHRVALTARSGERAVTLEIGGMTCGGCARVVRSQIAAVHGVSAVDVRLERRRAYVVCDRATADAALIAAVERLGRAFQASVVTR